MHSANSPAALSPAACASSGWRRFEESDDVLRPAGEAGAILLGDAQEIGDDAHRNRLGEVREQVDAALGTGFESVEQLVDVRGDALLELVARAWA